MVGEFLNKRVNKAGIWQPFTFYASVPFHANGSDTVLDFLQLHSAPSLYRFAWWASPSVILGFWLGSALVIIGGLVPGFVALVKSLHRPVVAQGQQRSGRVTGDVTVSIAALESDLSDLAPSPPMDSAGHASIPTLNADTLDLPPQENQEEPKDYRGEYYPVAHPKAAEGRHA